MALKLLKTATTQYASSGLRIVSALGSPFYYTNLPTGVIEWGIKAGTFCRTMWVVVPPILLYQYIRQVDNDKFSAELFYRHSGEGDPSAFYDLNRPGASAHWKIQKDLALIAEAAANPKA